MAGVAALYLRNGFAMAQIQFKPDASLELSVWGAAR
jgi:hypothetical protein